MTGLTKVWIGLSNKPICISLKHIINGDVILGNVITMSDIDWKIVHIDIENSEIVLAKAYWEEDVVYNIDTNNYKYGESQLYVKCNQLYESLSDDVKSALITKNVHGVEGKVWVPQSNWVSDNTPDSIVGTNTGSWIGKNCFQYFSSNNDDTKRIYTPKYNSLGKSWTHASPMTYNNGQWYIWMFTESGNDGGSPTNLTNGFRPFCAVHI